MMIYMIVFKKRNNVNVTKALKKLFFVNFFLNIISALFELKVLVLCKVLEITTSLNDNFVFV